MEMMHVLSLPFSDTLHTYTSLHDAPKSEAGPNILPPICYSVSNTAELCHSFVRGACD
jgi:hypothetical protein